ncbi:MAG: hypothetical protein KGZ71_04355 [Desulfobulbaceae bacterium]|nr:hypothetical protein [Candidatus Kapabacteria bacterium]MBS3999694.1 hypothetical protein [Desulfobulbaceae bacterium]
MKESKLDRFCVISNKISDVTVTLSASPNVVVGGEFRLYNETVDTPIKTWKMAIQKKESVYKIITDKPTEIEKNILVWQILYCSDKVNIVDGEISLTFRQDGAICTVNHPVSWHLTDIPPCAVKAYSKINDSIMFLLKKSK